MAKSRANIFEEGEGTELDLGGFAPKNAIDSKAPKPEQVREVAQAARFLSREPSLPKHDAPLKCPNRRYRTGRNVQFNIKALQETVDSFYAVTDKQKWVLGYTLQRAIEALQRELAQPNAR
jgi:hypothetical protein